MQKVIATFLIAAAVFRTNPLLVTRVTDGDTLVVDTIGSVSLLGVDAMPGTRARDRLESLVINRWVRLEYDVDSRDATIRRRAYVVLQTGECVNTTLVREGLARVVRRGQLSRRQELERAEEEARQFRRGMWAGYTAARP